MLAGPIVVRELTIDPRKVKHFGLRAGYVAALCVLVFTCSQSTFSGTIPRALGDISHFSVFVFNLICTVQLLMVIGASLIFSAGNISQEKDRRTLILLLMTDLRNSELVIGKGLASLLPVFVMIAVSLPVLTALTVLGGITLQQVIWVEVLCLVSSLAAASWGTLVAFWREKTFQTIAITLMGAGLFVGTSQILGVLAGTSTTIGLIFSSLNPFHALAQILNPLATQPDVSAPSVNAWASLFSLSAVTAALWIWTCLKVRIWNPTRAIYQRTEDIVEEATGQESETIEQEEAAPESNRKTRVVWETPIIWREICTQAYGSRVGLIKAAYFVFAVASLLWLRSVPEDAPLMFGVLAASGVAFVLLALIALFLVNAQAVTSLTSERDGQTLELLLATEVSPKEFIFGKLGGVLFNMKEVAVVPLVFSVMAWFQGQIGMESLVFLVLGYLTLVTFAGSLGLHSGLTFENSRSAILNSLGTLFFLFVGIFVCMLLIVEARQSFELQVVPFFIFIIGGGLGLCASLTHKNPSAALYLSGFGLPFLTFYGIISFLIGDTGAVFLAILVPFGFTVAAILVPAVSAFDVALGRATNDRG